MAITRKLVDIHLSFAADGTPIITATAIVTDDAENTTTGAARTLTQNAVMTPATALRDAVLALSLAAGKPLTL